MTIQETEVWANGVQIPVIDTAHNDDFFIYSVYLENAINRNSAIQLKTRYTVRMTEDTEGLYVSPFTNEAGQKEWVASTQFESTHAREAFPCFDEPSSVYEQFFIYA